MKMVPNILTSLRIISIPFIIVLFALNKIEYSIILAFFISITDCFDGYIARKFDAKSDLGAKLDAIADKFFAGGLLITLSLKFPILLISFFLELIISTIKIIYHFQNKNPKTIFIGKVKTCFLFCNIVLGFISCFNLNYLLYMYIIFAISIILQIVCIICYLLKKHLK